MRDFIERGDQHIKVSSGDGSDEDPFVISTSMDGVTLEPNGSIPVTLQDQTTPPVISYLNQLKVQTAFAVQAVVGSYTITVDSTAGMAVGDYLSLYSLLGNGYQDAWIVGLPGGNVIELSNSVVYAYEVGQHVVAGEHDLSTASGAVTPQAYNLKTGDPGLDLTVDITRIMVQITCLTDATFDAFGDIAGGLLRGCVLQRTDGVTQNIFGWRSNAELANVCYDTTFFNSTHPQAVNGLAARLTFAGQNKLGVVLRMAPNEDIQVIVQDDVTSLLDFNVIVEGSIVQS